MALYPFAGIASGRLSWGGVGGGVILLPKRKDEAGGMHYLPSRTDQVGLHDAGASSPRPQELLSLDRCETVEASLLLAKLPPERL
jgi:hypothetical protein